MGYEPVKAVGVQTAQGMPAMTRLPEAASKTFKTGAPLKLVNGYLEECDFGGADIIVGISAEAGHNLASAGVATQSSEGTPENMPNAVITPVGAWPRDGRCGIYKADGITFFSIKLKAGQQWSVALMAPGTLYGLTKDASGYWYLDTTDTGGNNAVAQILGVDPRSPNSVTDATVYIQIDRTKRYY